MKTKEEREAMTISMHIQKEREKPVVSKYRDEVIDVWASNLKTELHNISLLHKYFPYVFLDTEFPGFLRSAARDASEEACYQAVKFNVDTMKVIQLGLTLSDGSVSYAWQFNLKDFDSEEDDCSQASIEFLKKNGMDFGKNRADGVGASALSAFLLNTLAPGSNVTKWVTFHGIYDVAYMLKMLHGGPLPCTLSGFLRKVRCLIGTVYDVKYMARKCSREFAVVGLVKLAKMLGVEWSGNPHQAGHNSLLTAEAFWELKKKYTNFDQDRDAGLLYGAEMHGLEQTTNPSRPYHPVDVCTQEEEDLKSCYGVVCAEEVYGNFKPRYYTVTPYACYFRGFPWFHARHGHVLVLVPAPVPFYGRQSRLKRQVIEFTARQ